MATTLPTMTRAVDDKFTETWYEIRPEAIDNILDATILWLALREYNCLTPQVGGEYITRTIKYGKADGQNIAAGKTLKQNITKRETMAWWDWKAIAIDVNRSTFDDQKNAGPSKIKDYVQKRIMGAREDIVQKLDTDLYLYAAAFEDQMNGLFDLVPTYTAIAVDGYPTVGGTRDAVGPTYAAGTFGNIARTNLWWQSWPRSGAATTPSAAAPKAGTAPTLPEQNLLADMTNLYNSIGDNILPPNFIISDRVLYEYYLDEILDKTQIVRTAFNRTAADLGFETTTFMGKSMTWSSKMAATSKMLMLNMDFIELVYDPNYFFEMTEWFTTTGQFDRVAYIVAFMQLITSQPRRHGMLDYNSSTNA